MAPMFADITGTPIFSLVRALLGCGGRGLGRGFDGFVGGEVAVEVFADRFHVGDDRVDVAVGELAEVGLHDVGEALVDLGAGVEDRFADVVFVGGNGTGAGFDLAAEHVLPGGPLDDGSVDRVAGGAAAGLKEILTGL